MILKYSWKKIRRTTGLSSKRIICAIMSMIPYGTPRNRYDLMYQYIQKDFSGDSYLLNPWGLLGDPEASDKEIADYIALASYRNYAEYLVTNDASLDILHSPLNEDKIKQNRLLSIRDGRIHFKYEEVTKETK